MRKLWLKVVCFFTGKSGVKIGEKEFKKMNLKEDYDGLCISEKIEAQICGIKMAARNTKDGIEMLKKADESLCKVQKLLHKMNELSVQCASGTYSRAQREEAEREFKEYKDEIEDIGMKTLYNGIPIFDPSKNPNIDTIDNTIKLQIGANAREIVMIKIEPMNISTIGLVDTVISTQEKARISIDNVLNAIDIISNRRVLMENTKKKLNAVIENQNSMIKNLYDTRSKVINKDISILQIKKIFNQKSASYGENVIYLVKEEKAN